MFVKTLQAAVQVVGAVVGGELVLPAAEGEFAIRNAVGAAPDDGPEVRVPGQIRLQRIESEDDAVHFPVAIRRFDRGDNAAVVGYFHLDAIFVG